MTNFQHNMADEDALNTTAVRIAEIKAVALKVTWSAGKLMSIEAFEKLPELTTSAKVAISSNKIFKSTHNIPADRKALTYIYYI